MIASSAKPDPQARTAKQMTKPAQGEKHFDNYEECGCVDRWESEGGPIVGEDDTRPTHG